MSAVGVVDLGTARAKLTVAVGEGASGALLKQYKWDVGLADAGAQTLDRLAEAVQAIAQQARQDEATIGRVVATEAFRSNPELSKSLASLEKALGRVEILTPWVEARLLWEGVSKVVLGGDPGTVLDVGGGSIQVVWGPAEDEFFSLPIGTFVLEKKFQRSADHLSLEEGRSAREYIAKELEAHSSCVPQMRPLVVGSNVMADFFESALRWMSAEHPTSSRYGMSVTVNSIEKLSRALLGASYESVYDAFPRNPRFMHGADKALLVVEEVVRLLKPSAIVPTNEALSTAIARSLL